MTQQATFDENIPVRGFVDANGEARVEPIGRAEPVQPREGNDEGGMRILPIGPGEPARVDDKQTPYEPPENRPVLTDEQNWSGYSHQELYESVHDKNDPGQVGDISAEWERLCAELTDAAREINEGIAATESGWTGETAEIARAGMRQLATWVSQTAESVVKMADQVQEQARIMATARASMPEPNEFGYENATKAFTGGSISDFVGATDDVSVERNQAMSAQEQAVSVMRTMEAQSQDLDRTTPSFAPPYNPVTGQIENPAPLLRESASDNTSASSYGSRNDYGTTSAAAANYGKSAKRERFSRGSCDEKASYGSTGTSSLQRPDKKGKSKGKASKNDKSCNPKQLKGQLDLKPKEQQRTVAAGVGGGAGGRGLGGGGFGGGGGFSGGPGATGGSSTPQQASLGNMFLTGGAPAGPASTGGGSGGSALASAGGMPPPMAPPGAGGGRGGEDLERQNKYALSEDLVEVIGADLPPAVIGEVAQPKAKGQKGGGA